MSAPNGGVIQDFTYETPGIRRPPAEASRWWPAAPPKRLRSGLPVPAGRPSGTPNGTPGAAETVSPIPLPGSIVVNEVMSNTSAGAPGDMIEFYNTTSQAINIGGWFVSNSSSNLMEYQIAAGTVIAANGYYVLTQDYNFGPPATSDPGRLVPFVLNPDGDTVYLSNNYGGQPGGYHEQQTIPSMPAATRYGLYTKSNGRHRFPGLQHHAQRRDGHGHGGQTRAPPCRTAIMSDIQGAAQTQYNGYFVIANVSVNSAAGTTTFTYTVTGSPTSPATPAAGQSLTAEGGNTNFTLLQTPTFGTLTGTTYSGAANSIPYVSPLVTDEIMYDPSAPTAAETAAGYADNDFEYVELYNPSSSPFRSAITTLRAGSATPRAGSPTACPASSRRWNRGPPPPGRPPAWPRPPTPSTPI